MSVIKISDWMSKPVICAKPDDYVLSAIKKMAKHNIGCLVIEGKGKKIFGIITERDILKKAVAKGKNLSSLKVSSLMTGKVKSVDIKSSILYLMKLMEKGRFRDTPITKDGKLVGIITSQDVIKMLSV